MLKLNFCGKLANHTYSLIGSLCDSVIWFSEIWSQTAEEIFRNVIFEGCRQILKNRNCEIAFKTIWTKLSSAKNQKSCCLDQNTQNLIITKNALATWSYSTFFSQIWALFLRNFLHIFWLLNSNFCVQISSLMS
jgi:hypothetical protein